MFVPFRRLFKNPILKKRDHILELISSLKPIYKLKLVFMKLNMIAVNKLSQTLANKRILFFMHVLNIRAKYTHEKKHALISKRVRY